MVVFVNMKQMPVLIRGAGRSELSLRYMDAVESEDEKSFAPLVRAGVLTRMPSIPPEHTGKIRIVATGMPAGASAPTPLEAVPTHVLEPTEDPSASRVGATDSITISMTRGTPEPSPPVETVVAEAQADVAVQEETYYDPLPPTPSPVVEVDEGQDMVLERQMEQATPDTLIEGRGAAEWALWLGQVADSTRNQLSLEVYHRVAECLGLSWSDRTKRQIYEDIQGWVREHKLKSSS
jgi:hypothetical protein